MKTIYSDAAVRVPFGKHEGRLLSDLPDTELLKWTDHRDASPEVRLAATELLKERLSDLGYGPYGDELQFGI
jgi:uncharacterized protein (DUF3820 family)